MSRESQWSGHVASGPRGSFHPRWLPFRPAPVAFEEDVDAAEVVALARRRLFRWCAIAGLTARTFAYPAGLLQAVNEARVKIPAPAIPVLTLLLICNLGLLGLSVLGEPPTVLRSRGFCVLDIAISVGLNLWSGTIVAPQTVLIPFHDPFSVYAWATVALWTALRGPLFGSL